LVSGLELDQIENWANDIESVTADDVRAVVQNYLVPSADKYHAVTGYLMPQDTE
jgi:predicted Zn-dependent peptidase